MDASASTAEKVAGLLQNLHVDSRATIRDSLQVLPSPNVGAQGGELDPSGAGMADVSSMPAGYGAMEAGMYYASNGYPSHHGYYVGGYEYAMCDWDDYLRHASAEGVDPQIRGSFSENGPLVYHPSGFAYNPQHVYAPYASGTPTRRGQSYNASQGNPHTGNNFQHSAPSNAFRIPASVPINGDAFKKRPGESSDRQPTSIAANSNNGQLGARPAYTELNSGLYGRGDLPVSAQIPGSQDVRVSYEGNMIGAPWSDLPKVSEGQQRHGLSSFSISGQYGRPLAPLLPNIPTGQMHRPRVSVADSAQEPGRGFEPPVRKYSGPANLAQIGTFTGLEPGGNGHNWYNLDKGKSWSRGSVMPNNGSPNWDIFNEQNKGPRTARGRHQRITPGATRYIRSQVPATDVRESVSLPVNKDQYNRTDFVTAHDNAKFFIIKSYSEDDIHKSIKYSTWASTVNGNKKLDVAYREAQASSKVCPLFLFFSVNASGQFCGVAEMVGPVDFNSSLDFWQQDKWTGKVPVKWHIVKDVPNSQLRHIVLENNDNKPVTNSRDTQEVPLSQGSEMLNIFKTHGLKTSILDDFLFYETRQRFMQEKKARQQTHLQLQQTTRRVSLGVDEKPDQNDTAQYVSHDKDYGQSVDQSDKLSKCMDGLDRSGSLKEGASDTVQSDATRASL
eukprot:c21866_g1_i2 orf=787-2799(-)